jgi:hypothetical protein
MPLAFLPGAIWGFWFGVSVTASHDVLRLTAGGIIFASLAAGANAAFVSLLRWAFRRVKTFVKVSSGPSRGEVKKIDVNGDQ